MMIKTMKKGYVNLAKYSDFAIHHKQEGFTVIAMKPVVCYATESKRYTSAASVELGRSQWMRTYQKAILLGIGITSVVLFIISFIRKKLQKR